MHDSELVDVLDAGDDLLEEAAALGLLDARLLDDVVEKLAAVRVLHDEVQLLGRLDDLVELDDVRVADHLQDLDLAGHALHVRHLADAVLLEDLHGHLLARQLVRAQLDLSERALADALACACMSFRCLT